jgi:hypothetical protein
MNMDKMLKPAAIGGGLLGILASLPIIECGCCLWVIGGGFLAAYLYIKESPIMVSLGQGAILGFMAGIIGSIIIAIFMYFKLFMMHDGIQAYVEQVRLTMETFPIFSGEDQAEFQELFSREGFGTSMFIGALFIQLLVYSVIAAIGGLLGVAILEKRKPGDIDYRGSGGEPPSSLPPSPPPDA